MKKENKAFKELIKIHLQRYDELLGDEYPTCVECQDEKCIDFEDSLCHSCYHKSCKRAGDECWCACLDSNDPLKIEDSEDEDSDEKGCVYCYYICQHCFAFGTEDPDCTKCGKKSCVLLYTEPNSSMALAAAKGTAKAADEADAATHEVKQEKVRKQRISQKRHTASILLLTARCVACVRAGRGHGEEG